MCDRSSRQLTLPPSRITWTNPYFFQYVDLTILKSCITPTNIYSLLSFLWGVNTLILRRHLQRRKHTPTFSLVAGVPDGLGRVVGQGASASVAGDLPVRGVPSPGTKVLEGAPQARPWDRRCCHQHYGNAQEHPHLASMLAEPTLITDLARTPPSLTFPLRRADSPTRGNFPKTGSICGRSFIMFLERLWCFWLIPLCF